MVGELIKSRRRARGLSQRALATRLGMAQPQLSRLERGEVGLPQRATLERIGLVLGIALPEFYRAAGVLEPTDDDPPANADDAILADLLAYLREIAPPEAMDVLREMREVESDAAYRAAVKAMAEAFAANMKMGGKMLRIDHPGRES